MFYLLQRSRWFWKQAWSFMSDSVCVPLAWQETIVSWQFVRQTARTVCTDMQE